MPAAMHRRQPARMRAALPVLERLPGMPAPAAGPRLQRLQAGDPLPPRPFLPLRVARRLYGRWLRTCCLLCLVSGKMAALIKSGSPVLTHDIEANIGDAYML